MEGPHFEHLLKLKLSPELIAKDAGHAMMFSSLYRFSKYKTPSDIFYFYKSKFRLNYTR